MTLQVVALTPYPIAGPSSRQRVFAFAPGLEKHGIDLKIVPFLSARGYELRASGRPDYRPSVVARIVAGFARRSRGRWEAGRSDVLWVHRQAVPVLHRLLDPLVLPPNVPLVFDMDDAVFLEYPIDHLLRRCTAATVGNRYLADYVRAINPGVRCEVIPTVVDTDAFRPVAQRPSGEPLVVGWIGTASTYRRYLLPVLSDLVRCCTEGGARFRVVASSDVEQDAIARGAEFRPWSLATANDDLREFDLGVMPLHDDDYSRGKCGFKLIEYGAAGLASVGSDVGVNAQVIKDGVTGLLARSDTSLIEGVRKLLEDPPLRQQLGLAARKRVVEHFSLEAHVGRVASVLIGAAET